MNIVFISPHFPQNYYLFCARLRAFGVNVLGIADQPLESLRPELRSVLSDYYQVTDLHRYDELVRAIGYFTYRHGRIDRLAQQRWTERIRAFVVPRVIPVITARASGRQCGAPRPANAGTK